MQGRNKSVIVVVTKVGRWVIGAEGLKSAGSATSGMRWLLAATFTAFLVEFLGWLLWLQETFMLVDNYHLLAASALHMATLMVSGFLATA